MFHCKDENVELLGPEVPESSLMMFTGLQDQMGTSRATTVDICGGRETCGVRDHTGIRHTQGMHLNLVRTISLAPLLLSTRGLAVPELTWL